MWATRYRSGLITENLPAFAHNLTSATHITLSQQMTKQFGPPQVAGGALNTSAPPNDPQGTRQILGRISGGLPFAVFVQFHDILYKLFRDILYTPRELRRRSDAGAVQNCSECHR